MGRRGLSASASRLCNLKKTESAGVYENLTPRGWAYTPDLSRPAVIRITDDSYNTRLTWQTTKNQKIAVFADFQPHIVYQRGYQVPTSPEATAYAPYLPNAMLVASWKDVLTNTEIERLWAYIQANGSP